MRGYLNFESLRFKKPRSEETLISKYVKNEEAYFSNPLAKEAYTSDLNHAES